MDRDTKQPVVPLTHAADPSLQGRRRRWDHLLRRIEAGGVAAASVRWIALLGRGHHDEAGGRGRRPDAGGRGRHGCPRGGAVERPTTHRFALFIMDPEIFFSRGLHAAAVQITASS